MLVLFHSYLLAGQILVQVDDNWLSCMATQSPKNLLVSRLLRFCLFFHSSIQEAAETLHLLPTSGTGCYLYPKLIRITCSSKPLQNALGPG